MKWETVIGMGRQRFAAANGWADKKAGRKEPPGINYCVSQPYRKFAKTKGASTNTANVKASRISSIGRWHHVISVFL